MSLAYLLAMTAALAAGGCSLVYDADDLRAGRDGGASADADPDALFAARLKPSSVFEGEGNAFVPAQVAMVRAIPIVIEGQNMTAETVFTIEGLGLEGEIEDIAVSGDGHFAAFALRVPIDPDLPDGERSKSLTIRLAKGDEENTAPPLVVNGLDALVRDGGALSSDQLRARYTHVVLTSEVEATGTAPLRIVATAGIKVDGALRADGGTAPTPGPGGCRGGMAESPSDCGDGSGQRGETSTSPGGGGGGGYGSAGMTGTGGEGDGGGTAGQPYLEPMAPAEEATAHGAGGGGGGALLGGQGGGSGGVVELSTPAILDLSATAIVSAGGGAGEDPGLCTTGAGGGGGSGGAILLRAGQLFAAGGALVTATGGDGDGGGACIGGNGGNGRIRIDRGNDVTVDSTPNAFIGAAPVIDSLPIVVTEASLSVDVRGDSNKGYELRVNGARQGTVQTGADGLGSEDATLEPGLNELCVQVNAGADLDNPESTNCVNVAYIKP